MDRTFVICKPDAVERGLVGEIISRLERKGLHIVAAKVLTVDPELAAAQYAEHLGKPFYASLVSFITRSPVFAMVIEGPGETWKLVRQEMGATDPAEAPAGTIRGDLATSMPDNLIHGSDSPEAAEREIALFFPELTSPNR